MVREETAIAGFAQRDLGIRGVSLRIAEGGQGPCVLLIPGWPQSLYSFRRVMPALAREFRVVAIDPPGLGDSDALPTGLDTASAAAHLVEVLDALQIRDCMLVGFDVGAWIGYALAARFPARVSRLTLIDAAVPGLAPASAYQLSPATFSKTWHFSFNFLPELPEMLIRGREKAFLEWFFRSKSKDSSQTFTDADIDVYARSYGAEGRWAGALGYYRALFVSASQNQETASTPLPMPLLAIGGDSAMGQGMADMLRPVAPSLESAVIPNCGHYVPEENPAGLLDALLPFLRKQAVP